jgi:hypothetical protein
MRARKRICSPDGREGDCGVEELGWHRWRCSRRPVGGALDSHSESGYRTALQNRAAAARTRASRATKTVVASHDVAIFE